MAVGVADGHGRIGSRRPKPQAGAESKLLRLNAGWVAETDVRLVLGWAICKALVRFEGASRSPWAWVKSKSEGCANYRTAHARNGRFLGASMRGLLRGNTLDGQNTKGRVRKCPIAVSNAEGRVCPLVYWVATASNPSDHSPIELLPARTHQDENLRRALIHSHHDAAGHGQRSTPAWWQTLSSKVGGWKTGRLLSGLAAN